MPNLREYKVVINGIEHTQQLSSEDAERYGLTDKDQVKAKAPANKQGNPANKAPGAPATPIV